MKTTAYFRDIRQRPDRSRIRDEWIAVAIAQPVAEEVQRDGRIRRWAFVEDEGLISENVYVDLDTDGNLVSMTIEHAARVAALPQFSLEEIDASAA